jgi:DNA primase
MEIKQIKEQLSIVTVLNEYSIVMNKNKHCLCPFHKDDKPSLRIYPETNTYTCFGCDKTGDVIQFIQDIENCTKHKALKKAKSLIGTIITKPIPNIKTEIQEEINYSELYPKFKQSLHRSKKAIAYLEERGIYDVKLEQGYNNGTLFKQLKNCITYPLKNEQNEIVSFYGRSIASTGKHFYSTNRKGLYPNYPTEETKTLILTESIIDSTTLLKYTDFETLAIYGTNGFTEEHTKAITELEQLQEIILFFDGDQAGNKAIEKHSKTLNELLPNVTISKVETPENEDINSLVQSHEPEILEHLINEREFLFSIEQVAPADNNLNTENSEYIIYENGSLQIAVLGGINLFSLDKLKVTLRITRTDKPSPIYNIRQSNLDLYNDDSVDKFIRKVAERLELGTREIQISIAELINSLEEYRLKQVELQKVVAPQARILTEKRKQQVIEFLQSKDLLRRTNDLIGQTGMVGEENNRLLMFLVFTSRLREQPLHIISLGASGTGKTYLQEKISQLIPEEHKLEITALSENALYYFERTELKNKLVLIEDLDGAQDEKIMYAIRELMSKKRISKTIPIKDAKGNLKTVTLQVEGPICLAGTTTKERIYEDNANRSLLIYLDNSKAHKQQIMEYQQNLSAGTINKQKETEIKRFLQDVQLLLEKVKVRNPYATKLNIPDTVFKPLRTNTHYLSFIETVTFYHQYQRERKRDEQGNYYIETTLEDIEEANKLLKDVLLAKSDELTKACRDFLELLKNYVTKNDKQSFYSKEIREAYRFAPTTLNRHLLELNRYGYLKVIGGNRARGYEYELINSEEYQDLKNNIQTALDEALENIKKQMSEPVNQSSSVA